GITLDDYIAARDELIDDGLIGRGRGRGGALFWGVGEADGGGGGNEAEGGGDGLEEDEAEEGGEIALTPPPPRGASATRARRRQTAARAPDGPKQVLSYRHKATRVNNPEVGMVSAGTDPDGDKTTWAYDPHLDPVLNFDSARAGIERLIDDALASEDL